MRPSPWFCWYDVATGQCGGSPLSNPKQDDICRPCSIVPNHSSYKSIICDEEEGLSPSGCKESRGEFLAFLALSSCSSSGNQMHRNILVCFWWPWHYTTITRVSGQRCLLRPFVRFLASTSTSSCATDWRWTVNCLSAEKVLFYTMLSGEMGLLYTMLSGEMGHLLTATIRNSGESSLLRLISIGAQHVRLMNGCLVLHNTPSYIQLIPRDKLTGRDW